MSYNGNSDTAYKAREGSTIKAGIKNARRFLVFVLCLLLAVYPLPFAAFCDGKAEPKAPPSNDTGKATHDALESSEEKATLRLFAPSPFELVKASAKTAFVYDTKRGFLYLTDEKEKRIFPASVTKLFTALTALDYLVPSDTAVVGDELELVFSDSSVAGLIKGESVTVDTLLAAMMLRSGNDAAYTLAAAAGKMILGTKSCDAREAVNAFVEQMNKKAVSCGLTGTHFENPDGYHHKNHYTTVMDMIIIAKTAINCSLLLEYTSKPSFAAVLGGEAVVWRNTNALLNPQSEFYRKNVIGLKTGFTDAAGYCMMCAELTADSVVISGVFGCGSYEMRIQESAALLQGADIINRFVSKKAFSRSTFFDTKAKIPIFAS